MTGLVALQTVGRALVNVNRLPPQPSGGGPAYPYYGPNRKINGLDVYSSVPRGDPTTILTEGQYARMNSAGITDVRRFMGIPSLITAADEAARKVITDSWFTEGDNDLAHGVKLIWCLCADNTGPYTVGQLMQDPVKWAAYKQYITYVCVLIRSKYRPSQIFVEGINEPYNPGGTPAWTTTFAPDLYRTMRAALPGYQIGIQPSALTPRYIESFVDPAMLADKLCSFPYHGYYASSLTEPRSFLLNGKNILSNITWPATDADINDGTASGVRSRMAEIVKTKIAELGFAYNDAGQGQAAYTAVTDDINYMYPNFGNKARLLTNAFQYARNWAAANNVEPWRVFCSETGMRGYYNGLGYRKETIASFFQAQRELSEESNFGGIVVHNAIINDSSQFQYSSSLSPEWLDYLEPEFVTPNGWTQGAIYGTPLYRDFKTDISTGITATGTGALTNVAECIKITYNGGNNFHGFNWAAIASGALGKTYRCEIVIDYVAGTGSPLLRYQAYNGTSGFYGSQLFASVAGMKAWRFTATSDNVTIQILSNGIQSTVFRVREIRLYEVL